MKIIVSNHWDFDTLQYFKEDFGKMYYKIDIKIFSPIYFKVFIINLYSYIYMTAYMYNAIQTKNPIDFDQNRIILMFR